MRITVLVGLLTAVNTMAVAAQELPTLQIGDRVRVTMADGERRVGQVTELTRHLLVLRASKSPLVHSLAVNDIDLVEFSVEKERRFRRKILLGLGVGLVGGALIGMGTYEPCIPKRFLDCLFSPKSRSDQAALGAVVGGGWGLMIGAIGGLLNKHDVWATERLPTPTDFVVVPEGDGALGLRLTFPVR